MTFAIWRRVLQSHGSMPLTLALLLRSADSRFVATASGLGGQEDKTERELTFQSDGKRI